MTDPTERLAEARPDGRFRDYCDDCGCLVAAHDITGRCDNEIECDCNGWIDENRPPAVEHPRRQRMSRGEQTARFAELLTKCMERQYHEGRRQ